MCPEGLLVRRILMHDGGEHLEAPDAGRHLGNSSLEAGLVAAQHHSQMASQIPRNGCCRVARAGLCAFGHDYIIPSHMKLRRCSVRNIVCATTYNDSGRTSSMS